MIDLIILDWIKKNVKLCDSINELLNACEQTLENRRT